MKTTFGKTFGYLGLLAGLSVGSAFAEIAVGEQLKINGWIDMAGSVFSPDEGDEVKTFKMEEFEVDFNFDFKDGLTARADIDGGDGRSSFGGDGSEFTVEQAFVRYAAEEGPTLTAGKFLSRLGYEAYDVINLYQISVSATLVGNGHVTYPGMQNGASVEFGNDLVHVYGAALSSVFNNAEGDLEEVGLEGQVALTPGGGVTVKAGWAGETLTTLLGEEYDQGILNIWGEYKIGALTLAAEYNDLTDQGAPGVDGDGYLAMGNYKFSDEFYLTLRHSAMELDDGTDVSEVTVCPYYIFNGHVTLLLEYRMDSNDSPFGVDSDTIGFEAITTF